MSIKSNVQALMESQGVTVRKLSKSANISLETVMRSRDERIGSCTLNTLATIATALGVKMKALFEEED